MTSAPDDPILQARLDAELAALAEAPTPSLQLRRDILAAVAREPRRRALSWRETLRALWLDIGGTRLAGPALAMALAAGVGLGWMLEEAPASEAEAEDLLALAQLDDTYSELVP